MAAAAIVLASGALAALAVPSPAHSSAMDWTIVALYAFVCSAVALGTYVALRSTPPARATTPPPPVVDGEAPEAAEAPPAAPEADPVAASSDPEEDATAGWAAGSGPGGTATYIADGGLVVIPPKPSSMEIASLAGKPLPSVAVQDAAAAIDRLSAFTPHLSHLAHRIVGEASSHPYVRFRPLLLVGPRGSGKKRFARHLCETLGLHAVTHRCGVSDHAFAGPSKGSLPLQAVLTSKTANPCIILENFSRADNANLTAAILDLTDRRSARRYLDVGQDVHVDLSRVLWIAICHDSRQVPRILLDRFRKIEIPLPEQESAPALIRNIAGDLAEEEGLDRRWANAYSEPEIDMIADAWGGGSLYRLRALMKKVGTAVDGMDRRKLN
jgi:hypothetical protein